MPKTVLNNKLFDKEIPTLRRQLLSWYDQNKRVLPWRAPSGVTPDPYHVWLSEIMLQQTTVGAVIPYFLKFIKLWPEIHDLASAETDEVMTAWAGLGYYARARNLHKCAHIISHDFSGHFPDNQADLKKLPGIGDYTSAAITAIAYNKMATVVDGNVERVISRLFAVETPLPASKKLLKEYAACFFENYNDRPGDLAQAFMDLGATVCIPKTPRCASCPLRSYCQAYKAGCAAELPRKVKKAAKPRKYGHVYFIQDKNGNILLQKRPDAGLLGGMTGLPTSDWSKDSSPEHLSLLKLADHKHETLDTPVFHVFTHFELKLILHAVFLQSDIFIDDKSYFFTKREELRPSDLPTVFKKPLNAFLSYFKDSPT